MPVQNLIFDVGLHRGEDTNFYLKKGFRVVAFEANPDLVKKCREEFKSYIDEGDLTIIEGAIVPNPSDGPVRFYMTPEKTVFGTVDPNWANRNAGHGVRSEILEVPAVDFQAILRDYGIPYYVKIDIEGMDSVCLDALAKFDDRPSYISIESDKTNIENVKLEIKKLKDLGFSKFQAVQQFGVKKVKEPFPPREKNFAGHAFVEGASGLFGKDLPEDWVGEDEIVRQYLRIFEKYDYFGDNSFWRSNLMTRVALKAAERITGIPLPGWYDTHAQHESV